MKRHILMKRSFAAIMSAAMLTAGLSGCTNSKQPESTGTKTETSNETEAGGGTPDANENGLRRVSDAEDVKLKVWVETASVEMVSGMADDFAAMYPDKNFSIEVLANSPSKAQENIKKDPDAAADVFYMPHDQLGQMVESGVIYENTLYADKIKEEQTDAAYDSVTYKGAVYGYPYGLESMILYYNKSKLSEEDVKSFDSLTSKGKIGLNLLTAGSSYALLPVFFSNGCVLYGEDGEDPAGSTFNTEQGVQALQWIADLKNNPNVVAANEEILSNLESGVIDAAIAGPWQKNDMMDALGENFACAPYPTIDLGNGPVQQMSFQGVKIIAVNAATQFPLEAMAFADYLSSKEMQEKRYEVIGTLPSNKELLKSEQVTSNEFSTAVAEMIEPDHSVLTPKIPQTVTLWQQSEAIISDAYNGVLKSEDDMMTKLEELVQNIQ